MEISSFPKCALLGLQHFFSSSTNVVISILSVLGQMYKIPVFDKNFILFATVAMITEIVFFFSISIATIAMEINSFNIFMQLINLTVPRKMESDR